MLFNKLKKAIETLNKNKIQLDKIENVQQGNNWKASLKASLVLYLGQNSAIIGRLENLHFTKNVTTIGNNYIGATKKNVYDHNLKDNFKNIIDNSIQHIKSHGLYKDPLQKNFLSNFTNVEIISGSVVVLGFLFSIGNYKGTLDNETKIIINENQKSYFEKKYNDEIKINKKLKIENDLIKIENNLIKKSNKKI